MSDHEQVDESGINRTWLSGIVIGAALVVAAASGLLDAAPRSRTGASAGPRGVVIVDDDAGTALYGTVVVRGSTISVLGTRGETVLPRDQVRWAESETDRLPQEYWERYPRGKVETAVHERRKETSSTTRGCLVTTSGAVLAGALESSPESITVTDSQGVRTRVPRSAVRWHELGTLRPTAAYWSEFGGEPIDPRFRPADRAPTLKVSGKPGLSEAGKDLLALSKRYPKVGEAFRTQGGDWALSTEAWFQAYASAREPLVFAQLRRAAKNFVHAAYAPLKVDVVIQRVDRLGELAVKENIDGFEEIRELLANRLADAARNTNEHGYPLTARKLAKRMSALGGEYPQRADALLQELSSKPPRFLREGD